MDREEPIAEEKQQRKKLFADEQLKREKLVTAVILHKNVYTQHTIPLDVEFDTLTTTIHSKILSKLRS